MTLAERMRELTNGANQSREQARLKEHSKYVEKLIYGKIKKRASKGYSNAQIKIGKKYSPTLTYNAFADKGFEVKQNSKNGKTILMVKW